MRFGHAVAEFQNGERARVVGVLGSRFRFDATFVYVVGPAVHEGFDYRVMMNGDCFFDVRGDELEHVAAR